MSSLINIGFMNFFVNLRQEVKKPMRRGHVINGLYCRTQKMPRHFLLLYRKFKRRREVVVKQIPKLGSDMITLQTVEANLYLCSGERDHVILLLAAPQPVAMFKYFCITDLFIYLFFKLTLYQMSVLFFPFSGMLST